jgi:U3 small nucleolar RNA-associated protein 22
LICASLFVQKGKPLTADVDLDEMAQHLVPGSKERGFATVVKFLKDWKWEDGLFVPLYGDEFSSTPNDSLRAGSGSVWRVCSEHDPGGDIWTYNGPDLVAANRVKSLAVATWSLLQQVELGRLDISVGLVEFFFHFSHAQRLCRDCSFIQQTTMIL